uniref:Uncharacterized protein n=1 Tax=Anopheles coluzzii TaxID=1518534 RepID=A0A8W7NYR7_ANOCL
MPLPLTNAHTARTRTTMLVRAIGSGVPGLGLRRYGNLLTCRGGSGSSGGGGGGRACRSFLLESLRRGQDGAQLERIAALVLPVGAGRRQHLFAGVEALLAGGLHVLGALLQILGQVGHSQPSQHVGVRGNGAQVGCRWGRNWHHRRHGATVSVRHGRRRGQHRCGRVERRVHGQLSKAGTARVHGQTADRARIPSDRARIAADCARQLSGRSERSERAKHRAGHERAGHEQEQ